MPEGVQAGDDLPSQGLGVGGLQGVASVGPGFLAAGQDFVSVGRPLPW